MSTVEADLLEDHLGLETGQTSVQAEEPSDNLTSPEVRKHDPFYDFSREFWLAKQDLLPEGYGSVFTAAVNIEGQVFDVGSPGRPKEGIASASIVFDATGRHNGQFAWQLSYTQSGLGQEVTQLYVNSSGFTPIKFWFDHQGAAAKPPIINEFSKHLAEKDIQKLLDSDFFKQAVKEKRTQQLKDEQNLSKLSYVGVRKYTAERHEKELAKQQERISKIGFVALRMKEIPKNSRAFGIPTGQDPLLAQPKVIQLPTRSDQQRLFYTYE